MKPYKKTDAAVAALTPERYRVTQQNGTEKPGTGEQSSPQHPASSSFLLLHQLGLAAHHPSGRYGSGGIR
jgi:hypothetical protein